MEKNNKKIAEMNKQKIYCEVKNCSYNNGECVCNAEKVSVGPGYARSCTDTVCATFKSKNND